VEKETSRPLVLASSSPRRRELLGHFGLPFSITVPEVDESLLPGEDPSAHVGRLAVAKAEAVAGKAGGGFVVAGDTVVVLDGEIIGKPGGPGEARAMLRRLSGRTHSVYSGVAVADASTGEMRTAVVRSGVTMAVITPGEIRRYVETGEPLDKAGAYAVQGRGGKYVTAVEGSVTNVIGLPLRELHRLLEASGCRVPLPDIPL
jgi:septum formation protein